jgi:HlyD family secretion protein
MQAANRRSEAGGLTATDLSIRNHARAGVFVVVGLLGGLLAWSALAEISGAVIAPGLVAVETSAKKVQHPEGGVVAELKVREGDRVRAGDLLLRLDDTVLRASLAIVTKSLDEFISLEARLSAERDGAETVTFPDALLKRAEASVDAEASMRGQKTIFESRRAARATAKTQLAEQIAQLESSIEGLTAQRGARERELGFITDELKGVRELYAKNLVPINRVSALERDRTRIEGERGKLIADIAAARGNIAEKKIQINRLDDDFRSEVVKELADTRNKIAENVERKTAAEDRLLRIEIKAPVTGMIHQLNIFTVGGVIANGEAVMLIIPENDKLVVDAQVEPQEIEHIRIGQKATVHFSAFSDRNLKDAIGEITVISPDLVEDQATRRRYYRVKLSVEPPLGPQGKPLTLVPGMPVEAFITKGERTVLAYLVKPIRDQMQRVFRE